MARKHEFRMDPEKNAGIGRFLLTQKQRLGILRWVLYSIACVAGLLAQDVLMSRLSFLEATTDIVPCMIIMIAVLQDADSGSVFSLAAACVYYFSGSAPGPYAIPILTAVSIAMVIFRQGYLRQGFFAVLFCAAIGMGIYEMSIFGIGLFLGRTLADRAVVMALTAAWTLVVVPVSYPLLRAIGKIGGEIWKE